MAAVNACPAGLPPSFRLEITDIALELVAASMRMMTGLLPAASICHGCVQQSLDQPGIHTIRIVQTVIVIPLLGRFGVRPDQSRAAFAKCVTSGRQIAILIMGKFPET